MSQFHTNFLLLHSYAHIYTRHIHINASTYYSYTRVYTLHIDTECVHILHTHTQYYNVWVWRCANDDDFLPSKETFPDSQNATHTKRKIKRSKSALAFFLFFSFCITYHSRFSIKRFLRRLIKILTWSRFIIWLKIYLKC